MHDLLLSYIINLVIADCQTENDFIQFTYAVDDGRGWDWIFARPNLRANVTIPSSPVGEVRLSDEKAEILVHAARVSKGWSLARLYHNGVSLGAGDTLPPLSIRNVRISFFADIVKKLGETISDNQFVANNPANGQTFATSHEGGITLTRLAHAPYSVWSLSGDVSNGWGGLTNACDAFLQFMDQNTNEPPSQRLAKVGRDQAIEMFGTLEKDSGNSCLLGVMIADIKNEVGQALRVVSFSANMCGTKGNYDAQIVRSQGSQVHMEIFHLERLGALLNFLPSRPNQSISAIDVGMLGLKTNNVVKENMMCVACDSTKTTELDNRLGSTGVSLNFNVTFLST